MPIIRKKLRCCFTKDSALLSPFFVALVVSRSVLPAALMQRQAAGSRFYFGLRFLFPPSPQLAPAAIRCILQSLIIIDQPSLNTHFLFRPLSKFQRFLFSSLRPQVSNLVSMISIIIPNYNGAKFLREAIDSALDQQGVELEVIVVDDGSTDDSRAILESYGDRIRPIFQHNQGASAARNAGLAIARGEYVKFLDGDDYLLPNALHQQVLQAIELEQNEDKRCVVYGDARLIDADGLIISHNYFPVSKCRGKSSLDEIISQWILTTVPLHRTDLLREVSGFDERMPAAQDYDLSMRLYFAGVRFFYVGELCLVYRHHQSLSRISTMHHSAPSFSRRYAGYKRHLSLASDHFNRRLPSAVKTAFAHVFWEAGRFALRCDQVVIGKRYFSTAASLVSYNYISGGRGYRLICRLLGPVFTETLSATVRRITRPSNSDV